MLIKYLIIIFSLLSFMSCVGQDKIVIDRSQYVSNRVYFKFTNNTADNINYRRDSIYCAIDKNDNGTELEGYPRCTINENDTSGEHGGESYWETDIPSINSATLEPSDNATSYSEIGEPTALGQRDIVYFDSFIATVTINNVSKKIVGFNEELYKILFKDKPPEFFNDVISYGTFYGASFSGIVPTDFEYNPCWVGAHTELTEYSKFSINIRYYLDIAINSIDNISVSLDKIKSRIGNSGYDKATNTCKFYIDEDILDHVARGLSIFPFSQEDYDNAPKDLTGRIYIITEPNTINIKGYGSDPQ